MFGNEMQNLIFQKSEKLDNPYIVHVFRTKEKKPKDTLLVEQTYASIMPKEEKIVVDKKLSTKTKD